MKIKKEFLILGVVILAAAAYLFLRGEDKTRYTLPPVPALAAAEITRIEIDRQGQTVALARTDGRWRIEPSGFAAAPKSVEEMLTALSGLTLTALVAESGNHALYELDEANRIHVKAWQGDQAARELYIGKVAPSFRHTFVRLAGDERVFHARDNFRFHFTGGPEELRDKSVLSFKPADITEVALAKGNEKAVFQRTPAAATAGTDDLGVWKGPEGKAVATGRLRQLVTELSTLQCEGFMEPAARAGLAHPVFTVALKGKAEHTLEIFPPAGEQKHHPALSSQSEQPFLLAEDQVQRLMVAPADLLAKETPAAK